MAILLTGTKVSGDSTSFPGNQQATFLEVPPGKIFQLVSLETKIRNTGNALAIKVVVDGQDIRSVNFTNLDSSFVSSSVNGIVLQEGARVYFQRDDITDDRFNGSCDFRIEYDDFTPVPDPEPELKDCFGCSGEVIGTVPIDQPCPVSEPCPPPDLVCDPGFHEENGVCVIDDIPPPNGLPTEGLSTTAKIIIGIAAAAGTIGFFGAAFLSKPKS